MNKLNVTINRIATKIRSHRLPVLGKGFCSGGLCVCVCMCVFVFVCETESE